MTTASTPAAADSTADYMGFVGVTTGSSSIMQVFPLWADILGLPTRTLIGHDLPMDATPEQYRALVEQIRDDPHHRGALVTTHKMNVYAAASDLFDELDPFAVSCSEISSIAKRGSTLSGRAKDPITVDLALGDFLPADYFTTTRAEVVILAPAVRAQLSVGHSQNAAMPRSRSRSPPAMTKSSSTCARCTASTARVKDSSSTSAPILRKTPPQSSPRRPKAR
ncbi:hypothetical protein [Microbacterium sp. CH12i]|uniref:hypothetical protein n=1 Tax=Microbacterium sp. CH12i TaxID=1479651 RepID=UPI000AA32CDE|nr:hypothetical protein [Microbacterium sp. CH12i]